MSKQGNAQRNAGAAQPGLYHDLPTRPSVPMRLHNHTVAADGSPAMTAAFVAYLNQFMPQGIKDEWRDFNHWWRHPYVVERLTQRFGAEAVRVEMARGLGTPDHVRVSAAKRDRYKRQIMRAVRGRNGYLPNHDRPQIGRRSDLTL